ncbi:MAG: peptidase M14 [Chlorobi bacterium]|nr:peptidase M14 [Chlorobiota bacterium]
MTNFAEELFNKYDIFKENSLNNRRIKHKDILPLIQKRNNNFLIEEIGKSYEGREIFLLKIGEGSAKIMLWSQMHGDEATATQALFDIFNFFENNKLFKDEINQILKQCTLYFVPMLNPDGAERFTRRNAQGIDINRDALRLEAPESKILMNLRDKLNADFGFNLHDQDAWYSAGDTKYPATLSFLAPTFNSEKEINNTRKKSMQVIVSMNKVLQKIIPKQVAKYDDGFMPTAFGDNIQKRGTSTILIESGAYLNDVEKQFVRKLNFVSILHALYSISNNNYEKESAEDYHKIPFNKKNKLFDYILRNVIVNGEFGTYKADIGIRRKQLSEKDILVIEDVGDLSNNFGFFEKDAEQSIIKEISIGEDADFIFEKFFI